MLLCQSSDALSCILYYHFFIFKTNSFLKNRSNDLSRMRRHSPGCHGSSCSNDQSHKVSQYHTTSVGPLKTRIGMMAPPKKSNIPKRRRHHASPSCLSRCQRRDEHSTLIYANQRAWKQSGGCGLQLPSSVPVTISG